MYITLYSTGCPKCNVLEKKLKAAGFKYLKVEDMEECIGVSAALGIDSFPILSIADDKNDYNYDFAKAIRWVGEQTNAG